MPEAELAFWAKEIALGAISLVSILVVVIWRGLVKRVDETRDKVSECVKREEYDRAILSIDHRMERIETGMDKGFDRIYELLLNGKDTGRHDRRAGDKPNGGGE